MGRIRRRQFLIGASSLLTVSLARAQTVRRVGILGPSTRVKDELTLKPFFDAMRELGWIEGRNVVYDRAYAEDQHALLDSLAVSLVKERPDAIYAPTGLAALAAAKATHTIPIVFGTVVDPVGRGLAKSLAHPGSNVTGIASIPGALGLKRLELVQQMIPNVQRVGVLFDRTDRSSLTEAEDIKREALKAGITVVPGELSNERQVKLAMDALAKGRVQAILDTQTPLVFNFHSQILGLASSSRTPVIAHRSQLAEDGALASYGPVLSAQLRRSASLLDKILRGATPSDIPIEEPTVFELIVNLKTARILGILIPQSVLVRADRAIE